MNLKDKKVSLNDFILYGSIYMIKRQNYSDPWMPRIQGWIFDSKGTIYMGEFWEDDGTVLYHDCNGDGYTNLCMC